MVYEYNGTGGALASYVLGGTGLISQTRGSTTNYFLQDGQGSTRGLTSAPGSLTDTYSYTAFGELFAPGSSGTTVNPYPYTSQQLDTSTGLYDLRARYYNPALGSFLSQDTYPFDFGNPIEFNRYSYTANNPINRMDPSGHLLVEYTPNLLQSAAKGAALGALGGAVYGIVSSLACGSGSFAQSVIGGAIGGAMIGAVIWTGVAGLPGLITMGLGAAGAISAYGNMKAYGANTCTVLQALASVATVFIGFGGIVGGTPLPPGLQPVWVGANSGASASAVSGAGVSPDVLTGLGAISLASMMSGNNDEVWDYPDPETGKEYKVGPHGKMPSPRGDNESHHGVMSRWMEAMFGRKYNANKAPAVMLPEEDHYQTFGAYTNWRTRMAQLQGITYRNLNWSSITEAQIRQLGQEMFEAADVPKIVQKQYWFRFNIYLIGLMKK